MCSFIPSKNGLEVIAPDRRISLSSFPWRLYAKHPRIWRSKPNPCNFTSTRLLLLKCIIKVNEGRFQRKTDLYMADQEFALRGWRKRQLVQYDSNIIWRDGRRIRYFAVCFVKSALFGSGRLLKSSPALGGKRLAFSNNNVLTRHE